MKIGYCTWGMPTVPIDTVIPFLAELGYDKVEPTVIPGYSVAGCTGHNTAEVSIFVQRRPNYDPLDAAAQTYWVLAQAFVDAGISRG